MKNSSFFLLLLFANLSLFAQPSLSISSNKSVVVERMPRQAMTTISGDYTQIQATVNYFDGLGRPLQSIIHKGSGDALFDIAANASTYDKFGRSQRTYTNFPASPDGGFHGIPTQIHGDTAAYSAPIFYDNSPLNRVLKSYGAGQAWRVNQKKC